MSSNDIGKRKKVRRTPVPRCPHCDHLLEGFQDCRATGRKGGKATRGLENPLKKAMTPEEMKEHMAALGKRSGEVRRRRRDSRLRKLENDRRKDRASRLLE